MDYISRVLEYERELRKGIDIADKVRNDPYLTKDDKERLLKKGKSEENDDAELFTYLLSLGFLLKTLVSS
ncbi:MAG: hypothetical protein ACXQTX_04735 [Candidatus Syntropharchaeia archaeon]